MDKEKKLAYAFCILKVVLKKLNHELNVLNLFAYLKLFILLYVNIIIYLYLIH